MNTFEKLICAATLLCMTGFGALLWATAIHLVNP